MEVCSKFMRGSRTRLGTGYPGDGAFQGISKDETRLHIKPAKGACRQREGRIRDDAVHSTEARVVKVIVYLGTRRRCSQKDWGSHRGASKPSQGQRVALSSTKENISRLLTITSGAVLDLRPRVERCGSCHQELRTSWRTWTKRRPWLTFTERRWFAVREANSFPSAGLLLTSQGGCCYPSHFSDE